MPTAFRGHAHARPWAWHPHEPLTDAAEVQTMEDNCTFQLSFRRISVMVVLLRSPCARSQRMRASLHQSLAPIRRRQQTSFALQCALYGLLVGAMAGIAAALGQWWMTNAVSPWLAASIGVGAALG